MAAVTLVALLLGLYFWATTVDVCEVPPGDAVAGQHFSFFLSGRFHPRTEEDIRSRTIARLSGIFFPGRSDVLATLYLVRKGTAARINSVDVTSSPRVTFALGDLDTPDGRVTLLGCQGAMVGWENCGDHPHELQPTTHTLFTGRVGRGEARVVYVEGDQPPIVKSGMSIEDFARRNPGSYLVVTMRVE
jgi:hypothetical protein